MYRSAVCLAVLVALGGCVSGARPGGVRERALAVLREGLTSSEFWPGMHAAEGLTRAGCGVEVVAALTPRLAAETDDQRRCGLARELVRAGREEHVAVMAAILKDPKSKGRIHASESLYKVNRLGDREALTQALAETDPALVMMAAAALARQGDAAALARVRAGLADPSPKTRELAAWALGQVGGREDWEPLRKLAEAATEPLSRSCCWNALARLRAPGALAVVAESLAAADAEVRTSAAEALAHCADASVLPQLEAMLDDATLDARIRAADALLAVLARGR